jgi:hypothetical protein
MQAALVPGFPSIVSPSAASTRTATWSEPMIHASGWAAATANAFCLAKRFTSSLARSPGCADSSMFGAAQVKGTPNLESSSRLYFEVEARISSGGDFKNKDLHRKSF